MCFVPSVRPFAERSVVGFSFVYIQKPMKSIWVMFPPVVLDLWLQEKYHLVCWNTGYNLMLSSSWKSCVHNVRRPFKRKISTCTHTTQSFRCFTPRKFSAHTMPPVNFRNLHRELVELQLANGSVDLSISSISMGQRTIAPWWLGDVNFAELDENR